MCPNGSNNNFYYIKKINPLECMAICCFMSNRWISFTNFYDATVRLGDTLVILGALFWSTHIIFTGIIVTKYNLPLTLGAIQTLLVAFFSFVIGLIYEEFVLENIFNEIVSIFICRNFVWRICFCFTNLCTEKYNTCPSSNNFFIGRCFCNNSCLVFVKSNIRN